MCRILPCVLCTVCIGEREERFAPTNRNVAKTCSYGPHTTGQGTHAQAPSACRSEFPATAFPISTKIALSRGLVFPNFAMCPYIQTYILTFFCFPFLFRTHAGESERHMHRHTHRYCVRYVCVICCVYEFFLSCGTAPTPRS